ncbi:methyltransferase-like protein 22 [Corticium candelabrum]|uniref:methyltransferase-like protein 22 n=1 Tax=Corticium candelabrum TaxID=121492 RepID=UPI002E31277B|nr:methyltransferase-like protein 22 [Corticium candelabrum]
MSDVEDKVLSDVHVGCLVGIASSGRQVTVVSRFCIRFHQPSGKCVNEIEVDDDGDVVVSRDPSECQTVMIEHSMETTIPNVGQQVWPGALLLADFILHNSDRFTGLSVLELGGGTGLVSIILARVALHVLCTDIGDDVLQCCRRNIERNTHIYEDKPYVEGQCAQPIKVRELNWLEHDQIENSEGVFAWSDEDLVRLQKIDVIVAGDVVYSDGLTEAFISTLRYLMMSYSCCSQCYIATEKRFNFTLADLDAVAPAHNHFCSCMENLCREESSVGRFHLEQIPLDFPSSFDFERPPLLELWSLKFYRNLAS